MANTCHQHQHLACQQHEQPEIKTLSDNALRMLFMIMGGGTLFTYNCFVSCTDYFVAINPDVENVSGEMVAYQLSAMFLITIALLPFSTLSKVQGHQIPGSATVKGTVLHMLDKILLDATSRILYGFVFTFLFLLVYLILPAPNMMQLNVFSAFIGIADAISQSGLYPAASSYDKPSFSAAATFGAAFSGFVVSLLRLLTRSFFDTDNVEGLRKGADLLIGIAFIFTIVLIAAVLLVRRDIRRKKKNEMYRTLGLEDNNQIHQTEEYKNGDENIIDAGTMAPSFTRQSSSRLDDLISVYLSTLKVIWKPTLSAFLNFFITLSLFPGVIVSIPSSNKGKFVLGDWLPVVLITLFNLGDCAGRFVLGFESKAPFRALIERCHVDEDEDIVHGHKKLRHYDSMVWWPTLARIIYFPLFALCIIPSRPHPIINFDLLSSLMVFLFGLTNGFIHCANFTVAPTLVQTEDEKNATSLLLLIAIYSGLCLGAYFGLLVEKTIRLIDGAR